MARFNGWLVVLSMRYSKLINQASILVAFTFLTTRGEIVRMTATLLLASFFYATYYKSRAFWRARLMKKVGERYHIKVEWISVPLRKRWAFYKTSARHATILNLIEKLVQSRESGEANSISAMEHVYEIEYSSAESLASLIAQENQKIEELGKKKIAYFPELLKYALAQPHSGHYFFLNVLFDPKTIERVTGMSMENLRTSRIVDVGSGNGQFIEYLRDLGAPPENLMAADIVESGFSELKRQGIAMRVGRLEKIGLPAGSVDLLYLSYFIDYDSNQSETIRAAIRAISVKGRVLMEFLAPCRPYGADRSTAPLLATITRGKRADEDVRLICDALVNEGQLQQRKILIEKIIVSSRYVYNRYGAQRLPSYFIMATQSPSPGL